MVNCRYTAGRNVPISFNQKEDFRNINPNYFFLGIIISGYVVIQMKEHIFHLHSNALFSFSHNTEVEVLFTYKLHAVSISFAPEFINVNLSWDSIEDPEYSLMIKGFDYPCFDLFYKRNMLYRGILPLDNLLGCKINAIFQNSISQLQEQPDDKWSCKTRANLFSLFSIAEPYCLEFMKGDTYNDSLEMQAIHYINANLGTRITIDELSKALHTNRTTLQNKFKAFKGCSIAEYITQKRLSLAKKYLEFTKLTIEQITELCGLGNASYFSEMFKKHIGKYPSVFRVEMRNARRNREII